jgi:hypothetical protein
MAVERVIALFKAAKSDVALKNEIQNSPSKEAFIEMASGKGYEFNEDELNLILKIAKQTSLNPCSIEEVFDNSSDSLESEEDDTNDADSVLLKLASLKGSINRFRESSVKINSSVDINIGFPADTNTTDPPDAGRRWLALSVNIDVSEPDSLSWTDDLAQIESFL